MLLQVGDDKVAGSFEGRVARLRTDLGTKRPLATLFWQSVWSLGDLQGLEGGAFVLLPQITEAPVAAPVRVVHTAPESSGSCSCHPRCCATRPRCVSPTPQAGQPVPPKLSKQAPIPP